MAYEEKLNQCRLFKNTRNDRSDMTGQITIRVPQVPHDFGVVGERRKVSQNGLAYIQLALKPKWEKCNRYPNGEQ
jgi:hypothetical protein